MIESKFIVSRGAFTATHFCHGDNLLGVAPWVPGLLGLSRDYLYGQLGFWKNGERRAHAVLVVPCVDGVVRAYARDIELEAAVSRVA